jgi:hypothetical protein
VGSGLIPWFVAWFLKNIAGKYRVYGMNFKVRGLHTGEKISIVGYIRRALSSVGRAVDS